jgi:hypothetical protein
MDPDANLREQLQLVKKIMRAVDKDKPVELDDVDRLVDLVDALDGWLSHGGFLPRRWER